MLFTKLEKQYAQIKEANIDGNLSANSFTQKHTLRQPESSKLESAFQAEVHLLSQVSDIAFA